MSDFLKKYLEDDLANGALAHAYLCVGELAANVRGAESFARVVNGDILAWEKVEADGQNIKIEAVRRAISEVNLTKRLAKKVLIVVGAEKMTLQAANCFLKTLEEPPEDSVFILLSEDLNAVLPTITSRCRVVRGDRAQALVAGEYSMAIEDLFNRNYVDCIAFFDRIHGEVATVQVFLSDLLIDVRKRMVAGKIPSERAALIMDRTANCSRLIAANVNSRLALENLMLEF